MVIFFGIYFYRWADIVFRFVIMQNPRWSWLNVSFCPYGTRTIDTTGCHCIRTMEDTQRWETRIRLHIVERDEIADRESVIDTSHVHIRTLVHRRGLWTLQRIIIKLDENYANWAVASEKNGFFRKYRFVKKITIDISFAGTRIQWNTSGRRDTVYEDSEVSIGEVKGFVK